MVLAQQQKYRSMGQNRKPRDKTTHLQLPNKGGKNIQGRKGRLFMLKNEIRTRPNTNHKNKLKMNLRPEHKARYCKILRGKHRQNTVT